MLNAATGTGIIMGRRLLLEIGPHLRGCAQNDILTDHEDIELGRCIWRKLGIGCTNALDAKQLFFNNFRHDKNAELGYFDNIKKVDKWLARNAITMHPNKDPDYQRATHVNVLNEKVQKMHEFIQRLEIFQNASKV